MGHRVGDTSREHMDVGWKALLLITHIKINHEKHFLFFSGKTVSPIVFHQT